MNITLSPIRAETPLTLHRAGDVLTINGEAFDLSGIPEGATLPRAAVACDWLASDITRMGGAAPYTYTAAWGGSACRDPLCHFHHPDRRRSRQPAAL